VSFLPSLDVKSLYRTALLVLLVACRSNPGLREDVDARPMAGGSGVSYGDCAEANRRAAAKPDLDVDSLPRPVRQQPAPFSRMPDSVKAQINARGASVKVDVVVDTLGRPDMKTFKVIESSPPWLARNLRVSMPSWRFRAARLAGCKVPRVYKFSATAPKRG
jgi:hypothetical protein